MRTKTKSIAEQTQASTLEQLSRDQDRHEALIPEGGLPYLAERLGRVLLLLVFLVGHAIGLCAQ